MCAQKHIAILVKIYSIRIIFVISTEIITKQNIIEHSAHA